MTIAEMIALARVTVSQRDLARWEKLVTATGVQLD
jgi:hypothetical protein